MKLFRRTMALVLMVSMSLALIPALAEDSLEGPYGIRYAEDQTLRQLYNREATTLCSFAASGSADSWKAVSNCVEGLVTVDKYGNKIPGLAESWEISDDGTVYTFHLRQGLSWVDVNGNVVGELTSADFVAVAKAVCDPENASSNSYYYEDIILGATAYIAGETDDFETVGFKALDDYTIEIALEGPLPYFISYGGSYFPAYAPLLEELGDQYGMDNEKMYYIGPYIMTTFEPEYRRVYEKNPYYYDADKVYIEKVIMTYNAEATTLAPEMFLRGEIDYAEIPTAILDEWKTNSATADIVIPSLPDTTYMYYYGFNYDPQFDEAYEPDNWRLAVNNENFRQSLYWAIDRLKAIYVRDPYNPELLTTNSITPVGWCNVDGVDYTQIGPMKEITERANYQYNAELALEYKEKAVEELTAAGATFPIKLLMPYNPSVTSWEYEVQVVKQQLTELLGADYIECVLEAGPSTGFLAEVRRTGKYAFMKLNNGATIDDPNAWTPAFARGNSWTFMDKALGYDDVEPLSDVAPLVEEYYALVDEAKSIMEKSTDRYEKFAEAEAFLLNHALVIPFSTDSYDYYVGKINKFERPYNSDESWKGMHVLAEPLTEEQFTKLYADWLEEKEASLAQN